MTSSHRGLPGCSAPSPRFLDFKRAFLESTCVIALAPFGACVPVMKHTRSMRHRWSGAELPQLPSPDDENSAVERQLARPRQEAAHSCYRRSCSGLIMGRRLRPIAVAINHGCTLQEEKVSNLVKVLCSKYLVKQHLIPIIPFGKFEMI